MAALRRLLYAQIHALDLDLWHFPASGQIKTFARLSNYSFYFLRGIRPANIRTAAQHTCVLSTMADHVGRAIVGPT
jgi:hypothetical protein